MAALDKSVATLRIFGDALHPDEITRLLGSAPTSSHVKGQVFRSPKSGKERVTRGGMWRLEAGDRQPSDADAQVEEILSRISSDLEIWRGITRVFHADIFFGLFMNDWNEGFSLSPETLLKLGERGIEVCFDIYGPVEERG